MPLSSTSAAPAGWRWLAIGALLMEALLFTYLRNKLGDFASPVLLLLSSVLACGATYAYTRHGTWLPAATRPGPRFNWLVILLACGLGVGLCFLKWHKILSEDELKLSSSDVIPSISIYVKRLLAHEPVYLPFTEELGYLLYPTYLPGMWGPYLLPEWLRFDYRWMSAALFLVGIGGYQVTVWRLRRGLVVSFGLALLPFLLVRAVLRSDAAVAGQTVEFMIVGYYLLLMAGVLLPSRAARIAGLLLCLLSRYSLVFWIPLYLGLLYFQKSKREAVLTALSLALGVVLLFVVPFLSHNWHWLSEAQETYTGAALGEWQHLDYRGLPYHLYNGIGLGNFFYHFGTGELLARIALLKKVHLALLFGVVGGAALLYWRQHAPRTDYRLFAALVLKLYLAVFYSFIQVPYYYLSIVSLFASLFVLLMLVGTRPVAAEQAVVGPR